MFGYHYVTWWIKVFAMSFITALVVTIKIIVRWFQLIAINLMHKRRRRRSLSFSWAWSYRNLAISLQDISYQSFLSLIQFNFLTRAWGYSQFNSTSLTAYNKSNQHLRIHFVNHDLWFLQIRKLNSILLLYCVYYFIQYKNDIYKTILANSFSFRQVILLSSCLIN